MPHYIYIIYALNILLLISCNKPALSEAPTLRQVWKTTTTQNDKPPCNLTYPVIDNGQVFVTQSCGDSVPVYKAFDLETGETLWTYRDTTDRAGLYYNLEAVLTDVYCCIPTDNTVNVLARKNGNLEWQFRPKGSPMPYLYADESDGLLQASNDWQARKTYLYRYDLKTGITQLAYTYNWPDSTNVFAYSPLPVGKQQVFWTFINQHVVNRKTTSEWQVLDLQTGQKLHAGEAYPSNTLGYGPTKPPIRCENDVLLVAYDQIVRIDPVSGQERWRLSLPRDMLSSRPLLHEGAVYAAMENARLYRINASNGKIEWETPISGTPSRLTACGKQVFLTGGGDGLLYTINAADGRLIRKMKSPNHDYRSDEFFQRFIGLDCKQGLLLLCDGRAVRTYSVFMPESK